MTRLVEAVQALGVEADFAPSRRLVKIKGERRTVYVAEVAWGSEYYTWCDGTEASTVELYTTAQEAIQAGLRRAEISHTDENGDEG